MPARRANTPRSPAATDRHREPELPSPPSPIPDLMSQSVKRLARPVVLLAVVVAVVVLTVLFSHGIRERFVWGASGFVAGLLCGVLLTLEIHHRLRRRREKHSERRAGDPGHPQ